MACAYLTDCDTIRPKIGNGNIITIQRTRSDVACTQVRHLDNIAVDGARCNVTGVQILDGHISRINRTAADSIG